MSMAHSQKEIKSKSLVELGANRTLSVHGVVLTKGGMFCSTGSRAVRT